MEMLRGSCNDTGAMIRTDDMAKILEARALMSARSHSEQPQRFARQLFGDHRICKRADAFHGNGDRLARVEPALGAASHADAARRAG